MPRVCTFRTHGERTAIDTALAAGHEPYRSVAKRFAESQALAKELLDDEIKVEPDANDRYGACKTGAHDDLVTAVGLATQEDPGPSAPPSPASAGFLTPGGRRWPDAARTTSWAS